MSRGRGESICQTLVNIVCQGTGISEDKSIVEDKSNSANPRNRVTWIHRSEIAARPLNRRAFKERSIFGTGPEIFNKICSNVPVADRQIRVSVEQAVQVSIIGLFD